MLAMIARKSMSQDHLISTYFLLDRFAYAVVSKCFTRNQCLAVLLLANRHVRAYRMIAYLTARMSAVVCRVATLPKGRRVRSLLLYIDEVARTLNVSTKWAQMR